MNQKQRIFQLIVNAAISADRHFLGFYKQVFSMLDPTLSTEYRGLAPIRWAKFPHTLWRHTVTGQKVLNSYGDPEVQSLLSTPRTITDYVISEELGVLAYLLGKQQLCLVPLSYLTYQDHT